MPKCVLWRNVAFFFSLLLYTRVIFIGFVVHEIFLYYCLLVLQTNIQKKIHVSIKWVQLSNYWYSVCPWLDKRTVDQLFNLF